MDASRRDMCIVAVGNTRLARCMSQATCFVLYDGNRTARLHLEEMKERPGGSFESQPGLKGGCAAGGIPACLVKGRESNSKTSAIFYIF